MTKKIAVVFSAESRTFNSITAERWLLWKNKIEEEHDIEFTFYGHTWDHCPVEDIPDTKILPLKHIWIDSENIISDWVCESYRRRVYHSHNDTYIGKIDPNDDVTKIKFIDETLFHSRRHWGQHVSGFLSFKNIPYDQFSQFDGFIKARWDAAPINYKNVSSDEVKNLLWFFKQKEAIFGSNITGTSISSKPFFHPEIVVTPNDVTFFMTKQAATNFSMGSIKNFLDTIEHFNSNYTSTGAGHTLWSMIFSYRNVRYVPNTDTNPMFRFKLIRPPNYKPNEYKYF